MTWRRWAGLQITVLVWGLLAGPPVEAQRVQRDSLNGYGLLLRKFYNAAEQQGRSDWPRLDQGQKGTQVHLTFDESNADVTLVTNPSYGLASLLADSQSLARALGAPQADYYIRQGKTTISVDIELNKYLHREKLRTEYCFKLGSLAIWLRGSSLPRPIRIAIDAHDATEATLQAGRDSRSLQGITFLKPEAIPRSAAVVMSSSVPWYATIGALLLLFLFFSPPLLVFRSKKNSSPPEESGTDDPVQVQRKYDRTPSVWIISGLMLLMSAVIFVGMEPSFRALHMLLPMPLTSLMYIVMAVNAVAFLSRSYSERKRERASSEQTENSETVSAKTVRAEIQRRAQRMFFWMMIPMGLMMLLTLVPAYTPQHLLWRKYCFFGILGLGALALPLVLYRSVKQNRRPILDGPWYEMVQDLASRAGVQVKHVVLTPSVSCNAFASVLGTIGMTEGLLQKLEPEEVEAILAHEIGHVKRRHAPKQLAISLLAIAIVFGLWMALTQALHGYIPKSLDLLLETPLICIFLLNPILWTITGSLNRRQEREADVFAVEMLGDKELLIRSLERVHTLNAMPHRLKRGDEVVSTHPSLINRVEAIRALDVIGHQPPRQAD